VDRLTPDAKPPRFEITARDPSGAARTGELRTPHGTIETPAFFPVGTYGAVRGILPEQLREVGAQGLLTNTYHLHLRPGEALVASLGGLHGFMGWDGPILTDSGGFQIHSLDEYCTRSEEGVEFRSPVDGSRHFLSPESCIEVQEALGADLIVVLDEFEPVSPRADGTDRTRARAAMERTLRWAERGRKAHARADQLLFGIVQGGGFPEMRAESARRTAELGFRAHAIGGLGLGESPRHREELVQAAIEPLPEEAPRYLMGIGLPEDLLAAISRGVDLFDCVIPTRHGRHGSVFTRDGTLHLRNARFRDDPDPIEPDCACPACRRFSRAYLRHLIKSGEMLGQILPSLHNIAFYMRLLAEARVSISNRSLKVFLEEWRRRYSSGEEGGSSGSSAAAHNPA
jgi:queuine tRNA-ribosyltransferase